MGHQQDLELMPEVVAVVITVATTPIGIFRVDIPWVDIKMPDAASVGDFIANNGSYKIGES